MPAPANETDAAFEHALAADPSSMSAWMDLADRHRESGRWIAAAAAAARAVRAGPGDSAALTAQALALLGADDAVGATDAARRAVAALPVSAPARRALALALLRSGRTEEAVREAEAGIRLDPIFPEGLAALALLRMVLGRLDEAERLFSEALRLKETMAEAHGNRAAALARLGRDDEAVQAATRAIRLKPFLPGPLVLLGGLLRKHNRLAEAADIFTAALKISPDLLPARVNLADTLRLLGRIEEAETVCLDGLKRRPNQPDLLVNLGAALQSAGRGDAAITAYEHAIAAGAYSPIVRNNLARLHWEAGRIPQALVGLRAARAADPADTAIAANLALILLDSGATDPALLAEAEAAAEAAVTSGRVDAWMSLGRIRALRGRLNEAEITFREALRLAPTNTDTWFQTSAALLRAGERRGALGYLRRLVRLAPNDARVWTLLGNALRGLRFSSDDQEMRADLLTALRNPAVEVTHLGEAILSLIGQTPAWMALRAARRNPTAVTEDLRAGVYDGLTEDTLLRTYLETEVVAEAEAEADLTALRTALLAEAADPQSPVPDAGTWPRFAAALATQCFLNEYIFAEREAETASVASLAERLTTGGLSSGRLAVLAAYRSLHRLLPSEPSTRPEALALLFRRQFDEPRREAAIEAALPILTPIGDPVSLAVRQQYEESPHPRWVRAGLLERPLQVPVAMRALFPHLAVEPAPWCESPEILIAGCGTGREAVWAANQFAGARVLAVDLSRASLAYGERQATDLGITGITHAQADLTELADLGRSFDIIQSVGVLHHIADPLAGWRVLTDLLRPHGLMKIGLYSEIARRPIVAGRELIEQAGLAPSLDGIRTFRRIVHDLPDDHPVKPVVHSTDFYNASACRDLLFHVREHRLTLPEIARWIEELGLEFIGFQFEETEVPRLYRARFPNDPTLRSLANWQRFETEFPSTFAALYQFWVRRKP
jgi:tetratricopeptide (TPR) repeat protein/SAM-dependent methyltransferase